MGPKIGFVSSIEKDRTKRRSEPTEFQTNIATSKRNDNCSVNSSGILNTDDECTIALPLVIRKIVTRGRVWRIPWCYRWFWRPPFPKAHAYLRFVDRAQTREYIIVHRSSRDRNNNANQTPVFVTFAVAKRWRWKIAFQLRLSMAG